MYLFKITISICIAVTLFQSCSDDCDFVVPLTYFHGQFDEYKLDGDGLAFIKEDSMMQLRLIAGDASIFYDITIDLSNLTVGLNAIEEGDATISEITQLDIGTDSFISNSESTDFVDFKWRTNREYVEGRFQFEAMSIYSEEISTISGKFRVQVGPANAPWSCGVFKNFEGRVDCCNFL